MRVNRGDTVRVTFINERGTHDWSIDEFALAGTAVLQEGEQETIEFIADQAGEFEYYCSVGNHRELGMVGTLIVEEEAMTEDEEPQTLREFMITYTDEGYSHTSITIARGTTVIFRNESSRDMWPASDVHPTHTIYSEFDAKRGIAPGEEYSFTFARVGTWGFHDHLNPFQIGTITVTE
jgi:plastocyanin